MSAVQRSSPGGRIRSPAQPTPESSEDEDNTEPCTDLSFNDRLTIRSSAGRRAVRRGVMREPGPAERGGPVEMSSKSPAPFLRKTVTNKMVMPRDPRFDDLSGQYKPEIFTDTYKFLEDLRSREREIVQKKLRKARDPKLKGKLQDLLHKMDRHEEAEHRRRSLRDQEMENKRKLRQAARQGKRPFYLKKGDIRKAELADKYQELKRKGKLENFLSKKRKRNSHKDRRRLPNQ